MDQTVLGCPKLKSVPDLFLSHTDIAPCVQVTEGFDVLEAINVAFVDAQNRPLQNTRIRHTLVLEDPFPDPPQLADHVPEDSPPPTFATEVPLPRFLPSTSISEQTIFFLFHSSKVSQTL